MARTVEQIFAEADLETWVCKGKKRTGCGGGAKVSEGTRKRAKKAPKKGKTPKKGKK